ncbi:hypothetical protein [Exiguobacterium sp. UBA5002]|uniref:hypothetical protein n=1 Tax=Exiguobacterium sp. UBA5002 TaxID=1946497 RepID=UPI0025BD3446|nr:hypothetical protein [Exiguobacterium sp. UBA5002]
MLNIRDHGGNYGGGKYRAGTEYDESSIKVVTTKGNGRLDWEVGFSAGYTGQTTNYVWALSNLIFYKIPSNGAGGTSSTFSGESSGTDLAANSEVVGVGTSDSTNGKLRIYSDSGLVFQTGSNSGSYYYTSAQCVGADNVTKDILYGVGWNGGSALNIHRFSKTGVRIWSGMSYQGAPKAIASMPNSGAVIVDANNYLVTYNSIGTRVATTNLVSGGYQNTVISDDQGNIYMIRVDPTSPYANYLVKYNKDLVKQAEVPLDALLSPQGIPIHLYAVNGFVFTYLGGIVKKFNTTDLGLVASYFQGSTTSYGGLHVDPATKKVTLIGNSKLRKIDLNTYYTLA